MVTTINYSSTFSFQKPVSEEKYNISVFNTNMDLIDSVLNRIEKKNESQDGLLATKESVQAHATDHANPHAVSKEQVGLGNADNTSDMDKPVSVAQQSAILDAVTRSGTYTDRKIADLINGAPETLDTLKEIADAITENETVADAINEAIGKKADKEALGAYLPLTGGTITKGGNVPLVISNDGGNYLGVILKADSNAFGESNIRLTSEATSSEKRFMIQEVTEETKNLFQLSESNRKVYDSNSKSLKKILVEGEALPATGGKISGNTNPLLNIERTTEGGSASLKLTPGNGTKGGILIQSNYRESGNQFLVIRQNELNEILNLFIVSESQKLIHDYKTGTLKEILVEGDISSFQPGEIVEFPNVNNSFSGYVSNGTKTIYFSIPFIKSVEKRTISLEASQINVRTAGKYILKQVMSSNYKINVVQKVGNIATFTIENLDFSIFLNVENNTSVSVSGNFKFTFS